MVPACFVDWSKNPVPPHRRPLPPWTSRTSPTTEPCEAACYDCLLSYGNQRDHELLDRQSVVSVLLDIAQGTVGPAIAATIPPRPDGEFVTAAEQPADYQPGTAPSGPASAQPAPASVVPPPGRPPAPVEGWDALYRQSDSQLERDFLDLLRDHNGRPPSSAQQLIEFCSTRPDFLYAADYTAVYVDGPHHDSDTQRAADQQVTACLEDLGYDVVRLRYDQRERWLDELRARPGVFGIGEGGA